ncbi:MAG TPA: DUF5709 domain-containing protein [Mycobacteriales bacterium]|nr:DUF5709 domain-containing protein [Mycobacteriales bacterium]
MTDSGAREPDPGSALEDEGMPDMSDALPSKVITGDAQEELDAPAEEPRATVDFGVTAEEARSGEPLTGRLAREEPETSRLRGDGSDTPYPEDREGQVGRLAEEREGGTGKEQDAWAVDVGADRGGLAPEERAMHVEP